MTLFLKNDYLSLELMKYIDDETLKTLKSMPEYSHLFTKVYMNALYKEKTEMLVKGTDLINIIEKSKGDLDWTETYNIIKVIMQREYGLYNELIDSVLINDDLRAFKLIAAVLTAYLYGLIHNSVIERLSNTIGSIKFPLQCPYPYYPWKILKYIIETRPATYGREYRLLNYLSYIGGSDDYEYIKSVVDGYFSRPEKIGKRDLTDPIFQQMLDPPYIIGRPTPTALRYLRDIGMNV
jgi:hypothetical protein